MFYNIFILRKGLRKPLRKTARFQGVAGYKKIVNLCVGNKI